MIEEAATESFLGETPILAGVNMHGLIVLGIAGIALWAAGKVFNRLTNS
jgi:hypothetical protein